VNLGGAELFVVGGVVVVLAVVAAFLADRLSPVRRHHEAVVDRSPAAWLDELAVAAGGLPAHQLTMSGPSTMSVVRRYRPAWTVFVAIAFFPVGLVALVVRRERAATVAARRRSDGRTEITLDGWFDPRFIGRVNGLL
jgi:hypothetical protein